MFGNGQNCGPLSTPLRSSQAQGRDNGGQDWCSFCQDNGLTRRFCTFRKNQVSAPRVKHNIVNVPSNHNQFQQNDSVTRHPTGGTTVNIRSQSYNGREEEEKREKEKEM